MIHFCVTHYQNFNFCLVKLIWKCNSSCYSLSNSVTNTKMMKLIVTISSENVGGIISVGQIISIWRITTYLKLFPSSQTWLWLRQTFQIFSSIWVLFHEHSRITGLQGKGRGESIPLTPHYHFYPLRGRLGIGRAIAIESSPLRIVCTRTWTGKLWFPSASC